MPNGKKQFRVIIERGEDGYFVASVPALPGCHTQAKTLADLNKRIKEAISLCLDVAKTDPQYRKQISHLAYEPSFIALETVEV
ncbi:MAG: type II toxin-antitoxin system HicB family antitoxin [Patescibacteria group bacterium]